MELMGSCHRAFVHEAIYMLGLTNSLHFKHFKSSLSVVPKQYDCS